MSIPISVTIAEIRSYTRDAHSAEKRIGFVPTMGALHEGHAALIRAARKDCDFVVVSIFVNPTQFGPHEDFSKYPRTMESDRILSSQAGADLIFAPLAVDMYPPGARTFVEVGLLGETLCGPRRPGHFRGVCTVVLKLLNLVQPDVAYFGAKDYQQAAIITKMVCDLNVPVQIQIEPTIRDADGLALSSRNRYLSAIERERAPAIYRALIAVKERVQAGERHVPVLESQLREELESIPEARIDYAQIVDAADLQPIEVIDRPAIAAVAVFLGQTRLIDNIPLLEPGS